MIPIVMSVSRYAEYPCVKIDGNLHVTKSGSECECGKGYDYFEHPIVWSVLRDVTCSKCQKAVRHYEFYQGL